ncbi:MAG: hypothetical protein JXA46_18130 [Dehalococcoidales bacterium]|nr:hypothetical protein [Dehalococcoidales bacterium]
MKIVVCLKEAVDTRVDLGYGQVSDALMQKGLSFKPDPDSLMALAHALQIKGRNKSTEIILLSSGPERVEDYLREGLAQGVDKAVRVWEDSLKYMSVYQKARILSGAVRLLSADLVLAGNKSLDDTGGLTAPLVGAWLDMPCVCDVTELDLQGDEKSVKVSRSVERGIKESLLVDMPAVLAVTGTQARLPYTGVQNILESRSSAVIRFSLTDLGISPLELRNSPTRVIRLSFPRPRPRPVPLDNSLPAFYRVLALLKGNITKRKGEMVEGNKDEAVDRLFDVLVKNDILKSAVKK